MTLCRRLVEGAGGAVTRGYPWSTRSDLPQNGSAKSVKGCNLYMSTACTASCVFTVALIDKGSTELARHVMAATIQPCRPCKIGVLLLGLTCCFLDPDSWLRESAGVR